MQNMKKQPEKSERLVSLDALRGFDMLWITGGEGLIFALAALTGWPVFTWAARQMEHVPWDGFVFYDMIFPLFLFIAGVSMPFSIVKRKMRGESLKSIYWHVFKRMFLLVLLGWIYNGLLRFDFENQRWASVLGRIGLAWFFAAIIVLNTSVRSQLIWFAGILLSYWAMMKLIPVPGFGAGVLTPEGNLGAYIDQQLLPGSFCCYTYGDNEGILSTFPAISTALLGALTGHFLITENSRLNGLKKGLILLAAGVLLLVLGKTWDLAFPIIKNLWTSSFVLFAGGWSLLLLGIFYLVIDVWKIRRWSFPFVVIGLNSITIYMLVSGIINFQTINEYFFRGVIDLFSKPVQPLINAICYILCEWVLLYILYRKKIFLKV
jgi:predicted acyltransferase